MKLYYNATKTEATLWQRVPQWNADYALAVDLKGDRYVRAGTLRYVRKLIREQIKQEQKLRDSRK